MGFEQGTGRVVVFYIPNRCYRDVSGKLIEFVLLLCYPNLTLLEHCKHSQFKFLISLTMQCLLGLQVDYGA